jgi:hypothetical protein
MPVVTNELLPWNQACTMAYLENVMTLIYCNLQFIYIWNFFYAKYAFSPQNKLASQGMPSL